MDENTSTLAPWAQDLLAYEKTMGKPSIGWTFDKSPECWGLLAYGLFALVVSGFLAVSTWQALFGA